MIEEVVLENEVLSEEDFWTQIDVEESKRKNTNLHKSQKDYKEMEALYDRILVQSPTKGSVVQSKYIGIHSNQHCFSVPGFKDDIRVDNRPSENKYLKNTSEGDLIDVLITKVDNTNFFIEGSIAEIYENIAHQSLKALDEDLVVIANIKSLNPAGYDVEIVHEGITLAGFMPNTLAGINKLHDPDSIVGKSMEVMIESFSKDEGTYIVSRRRYLKTLIPQAISELEYGVIYTGHVTGTTQFGVFVEFNECLTGMIHKANVEESWQNRLSDIKPGFLIEFYVKEIVKDKIILTQILRETLWDTIKNGQVIDGKVKDVKQFGVLVSLDEETVGLIHTSEVEKSNKRFTIGQDTKVKILAVDRQNRKIFLTLN